MVHRTELSVNRSLTAAFFGCLIDASIAAFCYSGGALGLGNFFTLLALLSLITIWAVHTRIWFLFLPFLIGEAIALVLKFLICWIFIITFSFLGVAAVIQSVDHSLDMKSIGAFFIIAFFVIIPVLCFVANLWCYSTIFRTCLSVKEIGRQERQEKYDFAAQTTKGTGEAEEYP